MAWAWLALALLLAVIEVATVAFFAAFLAAGAVASAAAAALGFGPILQALVFVLVSVTGLLVGRPPLKRWLQMTRAYPSGALELIGRTAVCTDTVRPAPHFGHARIDGEVYLAESLSGELRTGSEVVIRELRGTTLVVEVA